MISIDASFASEDAAEMERAFDLLDGAGFTVETANAGAETVRVILRRAATGELAYTSPSSHRHVNAWREALRWAGLGPRPTYAVPGRPLVVAGEARVAPLVRGGRGT